jgi:hypothetical protein
MSLRLDDKEMDVLGNTEKNLQLLEYVKNHHTSQWVENISGTEYTVFNFIGNEQYNLAFVKDSLIVALVEFRELNSDSIQIKFINQYPKYKTLLSLIFKEILLKSYKNIVSDDVQTDKAFRFYQNFVTFKGDDYNVFIYNTETGEETMVNDVSDMNKTFGSLPHHQKRIYIIRKKD